MGAIWIHILSASDEHNVEPLVVRKVALAKHSDIVVIIEAVQIFKFAL